MEDDLIDWLKQRLPSSRHVVLGPGDDAAVLQLGASPDCVATVDLLTDGVDFHLGSVDAARVGHKALAVNLSDLAAMAVRPVAALVSLALPQQGARELAEALYRGLIPLAERFDVAIVGGDTNVWPGSLVISVTAIGSLDAGPPLTRSGAQPGDRILVTGAFGGSILGRHLDVEPRVTEALLLRKRYALRAGIDVSDGLALDLSRLARASGCGAVVETAAIPLAAAAHRLAAERADGVSALDHALGDGEDFELILAVAGPTADEMLAEQPLSVGLTQIGEFVERRGLWRRDGDGAVVALHPTGFMHSL